jgi:hypothetical protein
MLSSIAKKVYKPKARFYTTRRIERYIGKK